MRKSLSVIAAALLLLATALYAQVVEPEFVARPENQAQIAPPPFRVVEKLEQGPLAALDLAVLSEPEKLAEIRDWNLDGTPPLKNGFARQLSSPALVDIVAETFSKATAPSAVTSHAGGAISTLSSGKIVWGAKVTVEGAYRLRLHLSEVNLPPVSQLWVYNSSEIVGPVSIEEILDNGSLWTPSVAGPVIKLEVLIPWTESTLPTGFVVDQALEVFQLNVRGEPIADRSVEQSRGTECLIDAQCVGSGDFSPIESVQKAIALLVYVKNGNSYACTGGLLNDTAPETFIPYLLTANHCLSTQTHVSTLEAYWNYYASSCGGSWPSLGSLPKTVGGTLLATGTGTDFTLIRLPSIPSGRYLLGWNANGSAASPGTFLYRVSHPLAWPQGYSESFAYSPSSACTGKPVDRYLYEIPFWGGPAGGSSGAPVMLGNGQVVGQLWGVCGINPGDPCEPYNDQVDGRFSRSYPSLSSFLNPPRFNLTVTKAGAGGGTVNSSPAGISCGATCTKDFAATTVVALTATPAPGSLFAGWSGNADCLDGRVTTNANKTCTATFNLIPIPTYTLTILKAGDGSGTVTSQPSGITCGVDCSEDYESGTNIALFAEPDSDSLFEGWTGPADCGDGQVTILSNISCTAAFSEVPQPIFVGDFESGDTTAWSSTVLPPPDHIPPELVEFDFSPKTIYLPSESRSITVTARVTDDISGFASGELTFFSPSRGQSVTWAVAEGDRVSGTDLDGVYQGTLVIGQDGELGTWVAEGMLLHDEAGNSASEFLAPLGFPSEFVVATQPPLPKVGFEVDDSEPYPWVGEGGGTLDMTVLISGPAGPSGVTVKCTTGATGGIDVAIAGEDYTSINTTISWGEGDATPKTCSVPIIDDNYYEPGFTSEFEGFIVALGDPKGATVAGWDYVEAHIYDNDQRPTLAFTQNIVTVDESDGTATLRVAPTTVWEARNTVEVSYAVKDGTATAGQDFQPVSGSLQWNPKDLTDKTIVVPILDDLLEEGGTPETFSVELNTPIHGNLGSPSTSTVEVVDNEKQSGDTTPPQLVDFDFSPTSVDISTGQRVVSVTATVSDDISGVNIVSVTFNSPSGSQTPLLTNLGLTSGDHLNGQYEGAFAVLPTHEVGTWVLWQVQVRDAIGNSHYYSTAELQGLGYPVELEVTGSPPKALQVAAADNSNCALTSDGSIVCWGQDLFGQTTPPEGSFVQITMGHAHGCALESDGSIHCWGTDSDGEATPPPGETLIQVSAGGAFNCGLRPDESIVCWGKNHLNQAIPPSGSYKQVSAGGRHACALSTDDLAVCWGYSYYGQSTPPEGRFTQISAGFDHTCGLRYDGAVECWGRNDFGQIVAPPGSFDLLKGWYNYHCGRDISGALFCWGRNEYGQATPPAGAFTQLAPGLFHACALKADSGVACWGRNDSGQTAVPDELN